jgi:hypothetical protein
VDAYQYQQLLCFVCAKAELFCTGITDSILVPECIYCQMLTEQHRIRCIVRGGSIALALYLIAAGK